MSWWSRRKKSPAHTTEPPIQEAVVTAKWWGDILREGHDAYSGPTPTEDQIEAFEAALSQLISQEAVFYGEGTGLVVINDYHPGVMLRLSLDAAGIAREPRADFLIFPWRASTLVESGRVLVKATPQGEYQEIPLS